MLTATEMCETSLFSLTADHDVRVELEEICCAVKAAAHSGMPAVRVKMRNLKYVSLFIGYFIGLGYEVERAIDYGPEEIYVIRWGRSYQERKR